MLCASCKSTNLSLFPAEINIHFPGFEGLRRPTVWAFPTLCICADCGLVQFSLASTELRQLGLQSQEGNTADAA